MRDKSHNNAVYVCEYYNRQVTQHCVYISLNNSLKVTGCGLNMEESKIFIPTIA